MLSRSTTRRRPRPYRLRRIPFQGGLTVKRILGAIAATLIVLALLGLWLQQRPLRLPMGGPEADAVFPGRETHHPILLAVGNLGLYEGSEPDDPQERRADLEWVNVLEQVFGGCDVLDLPAVLQRPETLLEDRRLLVLPRVTLQGQGPELLETLRPWVERGLTVLLEGAEGALASSLGLQAVTLETRSHLTWPFRPEGLSLDDPLILTPPPLRVDYLVVRSRPGRQSREPLTSVASPGGRPLVWARNQGEGRWLLHALDVGSLSLRLRQGAPADGFELPGGPDGDPGRVGHVSRLAASRNPERARNPWLDAWLLALLDPETLPSPWPRLWPAPVSYDGWLLTSYADRADPEGLARVDTVHRLTAGRVTALLEATKASAEIETATGLAPPAGVGVRWKDTLDGALRKPGPLGPLSPWVRILSVEDQRRRIEALLPAGVQVTAGRSSEGLWPRDVDAGWRKLVGAGLRLDASFGASETESGWLFGSGMPYRPLSRRGLVHRLHEVPVHATAGLGALDAPKVSRWLRLNSVGAQGPVHVVLRPSAPGGDLDPLIESTWHLLETQARRYRHKMATMEEVVAFWETRRRCRMTWSMTGDQLRVEFPPYEKGASDPVAVAIPRHWHERTMTGWSATWSKVRTRRSRSFSRQVMLFEVPPEGGALEASYRSR